MHVKNDRYVCHVHKIIPRWHSEKDPISGKCMPNLITATGYGFSLFFALYFTNNNSSTFN